jgi:uncharacterized protein
MAMFTTIADRMPSTLRLGTTQHAGPLTISRSSAASRRASTCPCPGAGGGRDDQRAAEAPIVLFSMASSTGDDISRGMEFLNVAVSRAQALAVVVCSPALLGARCATVEDMRLVNMLCRFADEARV